MAAMIENATPSIEASKPLISTKASHAMSMATIAIIECNCLLDGINIKEKRNDTVAPTTVTSAKILSLELLVPSTILVSPTPKSPFSNSKAENKNSSNNNKTFAGKRREGFIILILALLYCKIITLMLAE
ncbi:hypothetical protein KY385_02135 [Candidatus Parcubacteria bacterium]|nr:hypothetical protein [Candidatus Parcubacteria bacterium]